MAHLLAPRTPTQAPAPVSPPYARLITLLAVLRCLASLPLWIPQYLFFRPAQFDSLAAFLFGRFAKVIGRQATLPPPEAPGSASALPPSIVRLTAAEAAVKLTTVSIKPVPAALRTAYAADVPGVEAVERPGFLLSAPGAKAQGDAPAQAGEKVIMSIHGGAYVIGHPLQGAFARKIALDTGVRVLGVQYRKCLTDATAFPAPLLDCLAAYAYLTTTLGFEPANILVSGESAGGHMCLALVRQLAALGLPLPGGISMASPWVDFTQSFPSWKRNGQDYLTKGSLDLAVASATRHYDVATLTEPFFSPALAPAGHWKFLAGTPVSVWLGTAEAFQDEDEALIKTMTGDGVTVVVRRVVNGLHAAPIIPFQEPSKYAGYRDDIKEILAKMTTVVDN